MSKVIRIQSTTTITVTCGLQHKDMTNPDAHIPDRLKVSPEWTKCTVLIREGVGYYPAEIAEWESVKALVGCGVFTLGEISEATDEQKLMVDEFESKRAEIIEPKRRGRKSLEDITE